MANKMLIDAAHPEETRVVVVRGDKVEEFDYESAAKKQLRGNIYLARVTRVEPSLQAAFVDYGGNRHGFLAFNEIHPDYYQIPVADRQHEIEAEEEEAKRAREAEDRESEENRESEDAGALDNEGIIIVHPGTEPDEDLRGGRKTARNVSTVTQRVLVVSPDGSEEQVFEETLEISNDEEDDEEIEELGDDDDDAREELPRRPARRVRNYKIQEVIKRKQVLLIQVVKEERGNKGAALTTYLSLAGRYTVLMPNTARGGGISRKITNVTDRKRLRKIADDLEIPEGMGLIIRTAGASRTKADIKRDFEYLLRLWESIRELTLKSTAPTLVYEEGNLIKRSIRDLYDKGIDEVLVAGSRAYKQAKDFMRMLMPSHAKNVHHYKDPEPIFNRFQIERQLDAMFSPYVTLKSGGYIVINQTEALVSIDVNSGKSTKEHSIEETALATNLEAATEISRQLRLRDLAGLIVIDFIDMTDRRNNRAVERRMKDSLKNDRARIQVGRISAFGLLEMSRQRLRAGVLEANTTQCPHCQGTGVIRSVESIALCVLRDIENKLQSGRPQNLIASAPTEVALYLLNMKRPYLMAIEKNFGIVLTITASDKLHGANFTVEQDHNAPDRSSSAYDTADEDVIQMDWSHRSDEEEGDEAAASEETTTVTAEDGKERGRRRRRPRRGKRSISEDVEVVENASTNASIQGEAAQDSPGEQAADEEDKPKKTGRPRRRGRRGGRRTRSADATAAETATTADEDNTEAATESTDTRRAPHGLFGRPTSGDTEASTADPATATPETSAETDSETGAASTAETESPRRPRRGTRRPKKDGGPGSKAGPEVKPESASPQSASNGAEAGRSVADDQAEAKPRLSRSRRRPATANPTEADLEPASRHGDVGVATATETLSETPEEATTASKSSSASKRRGWWQRR